MTVKQEREQRILLGLIEEFIKTAKPVGSNALKEAGFEDLSSATIRNYFASLETQGYLTQQHTSGGRIPTAKGYRAFAKAHLGETALTHEVKQALRPLAEKETKEISSFLREAAETLSHLTNTAAFLSTPRFDHDFVSEIKLIAIDKRRVLTVLITDFGQILPELMTCELELSDTLIEKFDRYFHFRITGEKPKKPLKPNEEEEAQKLYNETMVRFFANYSSFSQEECYRTGFSKLLTYPDFYDTTHLSNALSFFENTQGMRLLLRECSKKEKLKYWIGDDLHPIITAEEIRCSVITIPYTINNQTVGAIGLLGPLRMPYPALFGVMEGVSQAISTALTRNLYKHKISYRQPKEGTLYLQKEERQMLLEDKSED